MGLLDRNPSATYAIIAWGRTEYNQLCYMRASLL